MHLSLPAVAACFFIHYIHDKASFEEKVAFVYDVAPKVRIAGQDFDALDASTLKLNFAPKLKKDEDYKLEIQSSTVMVLTLQPDKK